MKNAVKAYLYVFCDQDDVWGDDKLLVEIEEVIKCNSQAPILYFSKAQLFYSTWVIEHTNLTEVAYLDLYKKWD